MVVYTAWRKHLHHFIDILAYNEDWFIVNLMQINLLVKDIQAWQITHQHPLAFYANNLSGQFHPKQNTSQIDYSRHVLDSIILSIGRQSDQPPSILTVEHLPNLTSSKEEAKYE